MFLLFDGFNYNPVERPPRKCGMGSPDPEEGPESRGREGVGGVLGECLMSCCLPEKRCNQDVRESLDHFSFHDRSYPWIFSGRKINGLLNTKRKKCFGNSFHR